MTSGSLTNGDAIRVGDVIGHNANGFLITRFGEYVGPLALSGARIAYNARGHGMVVYDEFILPVFVPVST